MRLAIIVAVVILFLVVAIISGIIDEKKIN